MQTQKKKPAKINCIKCAHYFVTWDNRFPHGCRAMDFKSTIIPSLRVFQSTGHDCLMFSEKKFSGKK